MQEIYSGVNITIWNIIENGIMPNLVLSDTIAYTVDPIYGISRARVDAELMKCLIRINKMREKDYTTLIEKLLYGLVQRQNANGSWNEEHVKYKQPSALITAIVGEALIDYFVTLENENDIATHIYHAKDFILQNEISSGYFKKSVMYTADHLNVDATCGAFFAKFGKVFLDDECLGVARHTAQHICNCQFAHGAFPYTTEEKGNYKYSFQIPCIHYQGVTIYYLIKINDILKIDWLDLNLNTGIDWLASVQNDDGRFNWSKSGLMFSYYLSGAYAFAIPSFIYGSKWDIRYEDCARKAMNIMEQNVKELANRWETASQFSLISSLVPAMRTANIGNYPITHRIFRFGYGMYRQMARRRFANHVNPKVFNLLSLILGIKSSTIEPENNFPDLFMTSEILDCLSYTMEKNYESTHGMPESSR